eukprot:COSAG03_NODE_45_length_16899_cov_157.747202_7_plen_102_part_00
MRREKDSDADTDTESTRDRDRVSGSERTMQSPRLSMASKQAKPTRKQRSPRAKQRDTERVPHRERQTEDAELLDLSASRAGDGRLERVLAGPRAHSHSQSL